METDASVLLQSVVLPSSIDETPSPPSKPARNKPERQPSIGPSLSSSTNFYDIPGVKYTQHDVSPIKLISR